MQNRAGGSSSWLARPGSRTHTSRSTSEINSTLSAIKDFASQVHTGAIAGPKGKFKHLLVIGIGGSATRSAVRQPRPRPAAQGQASQCTSSTTPTPTASDLVPRRPARPTSRRPSSWYYYPQVRRYGRNPQRHARGHGGVSGGPARSFASTSWPSPALIPNLTPPPKRKPGLPAFPCGTGWAAAPPNSAPFTGLLHGCPARASTFRPCSTVPRRWTSPRATPQSPKIPLRCSH